MKFSTLASTLAIATSVVSAHSEAIPGAPKIFGRRMRNEMRARGMDAKREAVNVPGPGGEKRAAVNIPGPGGEKRSATKRQVGGTSGQCGKGVGSCAAGYCCSGAGWCGTGTDYCAAPAAQFNYGSGADALKVPAGASTSGVARTKVGSVPYGGAGIYDCTQPNMIALTFDDGPYIYTSQVLDVLKAYNVPATFFITGNNLGKGEIDNAANPWAGYIQRMHNEGHQIASHTWSHQDLGSAAAGQGQDTLTRAQRLNQMYYNEMALRNILGFFPTYMRPPYSDCDAGSGCEADMATLGYHITYFDLDTEDYLLDAPSLIQQAKNDFSGNLSTSNPATDNWLVIGHDIHQQTAYNLTEYMITYGLSQGWKFGTVGQCLGDPAANWYRSSSGSEFTSGTFTLSVPPTSVPSGGSTSASVTPTSSGTSITSSTSSTKTSSTTSSGSSTSSPSSSSSSVKSTTTSTTKTSSTSTSTTSSSTTSSSSSKPSTVSSDGTCGGTNKYTCQGSAFGNCCSQYGWCGSDAAHCGTGCQSGFGTCGGVTGSVSPDGTCGGTNAYTCQGSAFGNCCSQYGWCGSDSAHCSASASGCQAAYGTCTA